MQNYPDLIIFDCDGVLVDSEALSARALRDLLASFGLHLSEEELATRFAGMTDEALGRVLQAESAVPIPADFPERAAQMAIDRFPKELVLIDGVREVVAALDRPFCVASNSRINRLNCALEVAGLDGFFPPERRFSSTMVAQGKPAPDLHLLACERMGTKPENALVIEDSTSGVKAAVAAGIPVLGFTGADHHDDPKAQAARLIEAGAHAVIEDLRLLLALLKDYSAA